MRIEPTVLVLDGNDAPRGALAIRLRRMGYRALRAKTPEEGFAIVEETRNSVEAALIPPDLAVANLRAALESLSFRSPRGHLGYVLVGPCPPADSLAELRDAGVKLALWEPLDDARLRFQVNRALADAASALVRRDAMRAPLEMAAKVVQAGRAKEARVYTLSCGGVYLETPRPAMRGAAIDVELDLWPSPIRARGVVSYTSVPGNLRKDNLPLGMGVQFARIEDGALARIRRAVAEVSLQLTV
jgi:response regulator RpfG family c-di-GMP phosphodiesterase